MAAHTAVLELEGAKAQVIEMSYSFSRSTDSVKGQPTKVVRNGLISLTIRSDDREMVGKIVNWLASQDLGKEGKVTIYKDSKQDKILKTIEFENAFVVNYNESFDSKSASDNTLESFGITAEIIRVAGAEFKMKWPDSE